MKLPTRDQLVKRRATTLADAQSKLDAEDFHGCADAMMDLREIDAMASTLAETPPDVEALTRANEQLRERIAVLESRLFGLGDNVFPWTVTEPVQVGHTLNIRIPAEWRIRD